MRTELPNGKWLTLFFLPALIAVLIVLSNFKGADLIRTGTVYLWLLLSGCYLFPLLLVYGAKNEQRGIELLSSSFVGTAGLLAANLFLCGVIYYAGCACAASGISRINH